MASIPAGRHSAVDAVADGGGVAEGAASVIAALEASLASEREARRAAEEHLRETFAAMIKHQQVGKSGDFRFNTVTGMSRGSFESYRLFDYARELTEITFEQWQDTIHPDDRPRILRALSEAIKALEPLNFEYRILVGDGEVKHIRCDGQPDLEFDGDLTYYGVLTDVTDRKRIEEEQRRIEAELAASLRLASMGELAGSIIHEINQPLAAIGASADACRRWIEAGVERKGRALASLDRVIDETRRAAAVVSGLRSLVRDAAPTIAALDVEAALREVTSLAMAELARERILLELDFAPGLPTALGDRVQVQQVAMNLLRNAIEAMRLVAHRRVLAIGAERRGGEVVVSIADNGPGIDADLAPRLFEALYTTKPGGMGLGLAISRKIVRAHGGSLWAEAGTPEGAVFNFSLPVCEASG